MRALADLMRNFLQVGYVTDDMDAAASYLESKFGTVKCVRHYRSSLGRANPDAAPGSWVVTIVLSHAIATAGPSGAAHADAFRWVLGAGLLMAVPTIFLARAESRRRRRQSRGAGPRVRPD